MAQDITAEWIAVDWGTSNLRAWAMQGNAMQAQAHSDKGMGSLACDAFAPALKDLIAPWHLPADTPIVACGMVGARQGWVEAPYRAVPCTPLGSEYSNATGADLSVRIIPGLCQNSPADVMRGEETQIAGYLALNPGWDGVICLPGTHTKWAEISAGEVVSFQTYLTGEMFALFTQRSVLRHSTATEDWDAAAFQTAVSDAMTRPERLAAALFGIRAADLLNATPAAAGRSRLSGLLVGAELAGARPYWLGRDIAVIGASAQSALYSDALAAQGVPATVADGTRMTLAGLCAARSLLKGAP